MKGLNEKMDEKTVKKILDFWFGDIGDRWYS